jgi:hypothetical protein
LEGAKRELKRAEERSKGADEEGERAKEEIGGGQIKRKGYGRGRGDVRRRKGGGHSGNSNRVLISCFRQGFLL